MTNDKVRELLLQNFPFQLTVGQQRLVDEIATFTSNDIPRSLLVIKGYAGTGKTTMVSALVKSLPAVRMRPVLLAPTGRAAKVLSNYAGQPAFTIHKKIYRRKSTTEGNATFKVNDNLHSRAIFIVDEASMISSASGLASSSYEYRNLLDDLLDFVYSGTHCKLILIGDNAQLPPVNYDVSPALDVDLLKSKYDVHLRHLELTEVVRQREDSGILWNATRLREQIRAFTKTFPQFKLKGYPDIRSIGGADLQEELESAYDNYGAEGTMIICRSNKRANIFNQQVRTRIRWLDDEIAAGDLMMVVRNNYFWLDEDSKAGFIANGEIVEIMKVVTYTELYGFRFATVMARLIDYPDEPEIEVKILLDAISVEAPSLSQEDNKRLYHAVAEDYLEEFPNRRKRHEEILKNEFFQALQVKFAYAVTCHKAQGGQWPVVFVDQGYLTEEMINIEYLRWLYTALTRATEKLYLVNFNEQFFPDL
jgi:exodeoxyribonuclease-5